MSKKAIEMHDKSAKVILCYFEEVANVFQCYKIDKFLIQKLQEYKSGYKINIRYHIKFYDLKIKTLKDYKNILT